MINIVCDHCLLSGYADSRRRVEARAVDEAVAYLEDGERPSWKRHRGRRLVPSPTALWAARAGVAALVMAIIVVTFFAANAIGWLR